ncbi:MAG: glycosyltransferase family 9 protein [Rhodospirillaceae bacterium]|nr:glycosyltransferase family 9 protein [Rhodospirillaceae bacterium]
MEPSEKNNINILVIKLGAMGDFIQALGPMAAIRNHHANANITLLTTAPYVELAKASGLFNEVWVDQRPKLYEIKKILEFRKRILKKNFLRIYDLQTSDRSGFYFQLLSPWLRTILDPFWEKWKMPEWSGSVSGASHPHTDPARAFLHTVERQKEQLAIAGINDVPSADLSWAASDISAFAINGPYGLLVPGGSAHRPDKRWAIENYVEIAKRMMAQNITPVIIGSEAERGICIIIERDVPGSLNLCAKTSLVDIATLGRGAEIALGNDTGPMHIIATAGAPSVVAFSSESDPKLCQPRGKRVKVVRRDDLKMLSVGEVWTILTLMRETPR